MEKVPQEMGKFQKFLYHRNQHKIEDNLVDFTAQVKYRGLKISAKALIFMKNHMTKKVFRNSKILHFFGVKSEIYQSRSNPKIQTFSYGNKVWIPSLPKTVIFMVFYNSKRETSEKNPQFDWIFSLTSLKDQVWNQNYYQNSLIYIFILPNVPIWKFIKMNSRIVSEKIFKGSSWCV